MADWPDDLMARLVAQGVGTAGVNMLISTKAAPPVGNAPQLLIIETGGTSSDYTQNLNGDAYENPGAQILVRGASFQAVRDMAEAAYAALTTVENQDLNGKWYLWIRGLQKFIDLGVDERGHIRLAFNILGKKRP